jgi:nicotinate-nucleotide adenylyltransferase
MAERIGLFGGSFDPIHIGHLVLAREAREQLELDRVIFIPAAISPHKLHREPAPAEARLEMVRAAIAGEPGFEADDCELTREGPSYTVDTARLMHARWPEAELFYFVGEDNLAKLDTWREIEALRALVRFVVLDRDVGGEIGSYLRVCRQIDVSSTEIRNRVARGQSIRYLLPEDACEVITRRGLYRNE